MDDFFPIQNNLLNLYRKKVFLMVEIQNYWVDFVVIGLSY